MVLLYLQLHRLIEFTAGPPVASVIGQLCAKIAVKAHAGLPDECMQKLA